MLTRQRAHCDGCGERYAELISYSWDVDPDKGRQYYCPSCSDESAWGDGCVFPGICAFVGGGVLAVVTAVLRGFFS